MKVRSDKSYKLVDGFVVCFVTGVNNYWSVDQNICKLDKPYIEEAEPLKFEVGKFYKDRAGKKWICSFIDSSKIEFPVQFVSQKNGDYITTTFEGKYQNNKVSVEDIIGEWED